MLVCHVRASYRVLGFRRYRFYRTCSFCSLHVLQRTLELSTTRATTASNRRTYGAKSEYCLGVHWQQLTQGKHNGLVDQRKVLNKRTLPDFEGCTSRNHMSLTGRASPALGVFGLPVSFTTSGFAPFRAGKSKLWLLPPLPAFHDPTLDPR